MKNYWKNLWFCLLVILLLFVSKDASGQTKIIHFNAGWNSANDVDWFNKLSDIKKEKMDIGKDDCQKKYNIVVVPTIVVFKDGEEIKRYQADLSFKIAATRKEIQEFIDELLMEDF
tara:strand:+ start:127 stop:474 length:348 start_codon:yes stop_codon:yes gene_type:complete